MSPRSSRRREENADLVRGIKAHAEPGGYSRWGMASLKLAKEASREVKLPVYMHLGTLWPELEGTEVDAIKIIDEVVPLLDLAISWRIPSPVPQRLCRDRRHHHPLVREALARGVRIDVGRGAHFSATNARACPRCRDHAVHPRRRSARLQMRIGDGGRAYRGMFSEAPTRSSPMTNGRRPSRAPTACSTR